MANLISDHLSNGDRVLWLVSGGSAVSVAVEAAKMLTSHNLDRLTISLADERYGVVGHRVSNWKQLEDSEFFIKGPVYNPILAGSNASKTTADYNQFLETSLSDQAITKLPCWESGKTAIRQVSYREVVR